ncbi:hypothetical protein PQQ63_37665 [Paraburkholderia metrosideri]|uniref:Uncharacterized protein n=1 Tax=Paraburkholderia metrosideri TaxID=580937 RepID=A0ABW9E5W9_9BURK
MDVLAVGRASGLILSDSDPHWKVDAEIVTRLADANLGRLPDDADRFGQILHGMGEIAAHCHAPKLSMLFVNILRDWQARIPLEKFFDAVVKCDHEFPRQTRVGELAFGQWISQSTFGWNTFQEAVSRIGHPDHVFGRFGLRFAAKVVLCTQPTVIDDWITVHSDHPAISVIGSAALELVFPFGDVAFVNALLESNTIAIKCLGAAAIVCPIGLQTPLGFLGCHKALVAAGFMPADAIWMTGMRVKNAVHARYRMEYGRQQNTARLRYLEQNPDKAVGGIRNAKPEMEMLRAQLDRSAEAYAKLSLELEEMLSDMATAWPSDGLSNVQMEALEFIFVDTTEIRHRLAVKLSHQGNRDWLLKRNITRLQAFIGLEKNPEDISKEYFHPDESRFALIEDWVARSLILLYDADTRGIGRRTSDLVAGVAQAVDKTIAQPFMSSRQTWAWQSIMMRAVYAGRFVFKVVAGVPQDRGDSVATLNKLGLEFAVKLLSAHDLPVQSDPAFHELAAQAVQQMGWASNPDEFREKWALMKYLPDFARALALWSSPTLVEKHLDLACRLFERVCTLPLSRSSYNLQMSRMLTLLDMALGSSARAGKSELILRAKQLWASGYPDWLPIDTRWEGIAEKLVLAIASDGPERGEIIADEAFTNSHCRRLIEQIPDAYSPNTHVSQKLART